MTDLAQFRPWLYSVARKFSSDHQARLDLAQEGMIAMWRASSKEQTGVNPTAFLKQVALNRMISVHSRQQVFGAEPREQGALIQTVVVAGDDPLWERPADAYELVQDAYFEGEVHLAVEALPERQRQYVRQRFWESVRWKELDENFSNNTWGRAKANLNATLGHLIVYKE